MKDYSIFHFENNDTNCQPLANLHISNNQAFSYRWHEEKLPSFWSF